MPEARDVVARAEHLRLAFTRARAHRPGRDFVVGLHDEGLAELTPIVFAAFRERRPDVRLIVRTLPYAELPDAIRDDRVDALLCLADTVGDRARFTAVHEEPPVLLTRAADALAGARSLASADVLDSVYVAAGDGMPDHFYAPFALNSMRNGEPARELALPSPDNLTDLIGQVVDHGAVIATNASVARLAASAAVAFVPLTDVPAFTVGVASGHSDSDLQNSLVDLATTAARSGLEAIVNARPAVA
jgi:DNA-binding transcriptional LysR family regulator